MGQRCEKTVEPGKSEPRGPQVRVLKKAPAPAPRPAPPLQAAPPAMETGAPAAPSVSVIEHTQPANEAAEAWTI